MDRPSHTAPATPLRWLACAVGLSACAPPSLRHAHSLEQGGFAVELAGGLDTTSAEAELLGTEGDAQVPSAESLEEQLTGDVVLRVGLGYGFEVGASPFAGHVKYAALDERRHPGAPLSIALTAQGGLRYLGGGLLLSRQVGDGPVALRPVLNVWYQSHSVQLDWALPASMLATDPTVSNPGVASEETPEDNPLDPGLYARLRVQEVAIPIGVEVPISVSDEWDLVPFAAYSVSIPTYTSYTRLQCVDCFAGLGGIELTRRSHLWVGVKLQPPLRRASDDPASPSGPEESP